MNYKLYAGIAIALALVASGWTLRGWRDDSIKVAIMEAAKAAQLETAQEIAKIEVKNTVIQQKIIEHTFHDPVYQDCKQSPEDFQYIKDLFK